MPPFKLNLKIVNRSGLVHLQATGIDIDQMQGTHALWTLDPCNMFRFPQFDGWIRHQADLDAGTLGRLRNASDSLDTRAVTEISGHSLHCL